MIPNLIKFGITIFLKTVCKRIKIRRIDIKFSDESHIRNIEELIIEAEQIEFRNLYINKLKLTSSDLSIGFNKKTKSLNIDNYNMIFLLQLNSANLSNILLNDLSKELRFKIESFADQKGSIYGINIINHAINILYIKNDIITKRSYEILLNDNKLFLKDISNNNILNIHIDSKIEFKSVLIGKNELSLIFKSKVKI